MRRIPGGDAGAICAVFAFGFAVFWAFRSLGWFVQDEGVLYYHYLRTHRGQVPYADFFIGYGPVAPYLHSLLFSLFGVSLDATRVFMVLVNATSGALLYIVARAVSSPLYAAAAALTFITQQSGDISEMAFHNMPYPLWYLVLLFAVAAWTLYRAIAAPSQRARAGWMFLIGVAGGTALFTKQNGGIHLLWAATGFLASYPLVAGTTPEGGLWRAARAIYLALIPLSTLALIWTFITPATLAAFVLPTAGLALVGAQRRFSREAVWVAVRCALWIAAGALAATLPWIALFAGSIGVGGFFRAIFFWAKYIDRQLYLSYPMPGQLAAFLLAGALLPWYSVAVARRWGWEAVPPWARRSVIGLWAAAGAVLAAFLGYHWFEIRRIVLFQYNPWRIYRESSMALDSGLSYLVFPVMAAALLVAWRQARGVERPGDPPPAPFLALLWMAICSFLLYYPRMDAAHFISAAELLYCVAAGLVATGGRRIGEAFGAVRGPRLQRIALAAVAAAVLFAANLKLAPKVYSVVMLRKDGDGFPLVATPREEFVSDRANVYFPIYDETHRGSYRAFTEAVEYLRSETREDEPIFAFPAFPLIYFVSERDNPTRHDYFLANNVPFDEQLRLLNTLEESAVRFLVLPSDEDYFVEVGRPFHNLLWAYFRQEFYLDRRFAPYDVWRRYDRPVGESGSAAAGASRAETGAGAALGGP